MADFHKFAVAVKAQFDMLAKNTLFVTVSDKDTVWAKYLASFPEGTNPMYRVRTEHDCGCCKQFIRGLGNVVGVVDGKVQSIWRVKGLQTPYKEVAEALADMVESHPITSLFLTKEPRYGAEQTLEKLDDGTIHRWEHFHAVVPPAHFTGKVGEKVGEFNTVAQLFQRGLDELTTDALDTVLDLIDSNSIYRGAEFKRSVAEFRSMQERYKRLPDSFHRNVFVWANAAHPVARFRNTVIGTLVQDLSGDTTVEAAVASFESKVAPQNYKRPTALITQRMVKDAMQTIKALDLESALNRRMARISDIEVNNVLWVNNATRGQMKDELESLLLSAVKPQPVGTVPAKDISVDEFMAKIAPHASSIDMFVKNAHQSNFVCLTAPVDTSASPLFKWDNGFAWSYDGNITDSIKEKVKRAGGSVDAPLRISLGWFNYDDLDLHVVEPLGRTINFMNKRAGGGTLDVDMNAGGGRSRTPVENVVFGKIVNGKYLVMVNQFSKRETSDVGFVLEIEAEGKITQYSYPKAVSGTIRALELEAVNGHITGVKVLNSDITGQGISQEKWGVKTESFVSVSTILNSPNHWDGQAIGNKHWFFILEGCRNDVPARGIYNEFLSSELEKHRKVFEVLGDKTKCQPTDDQLAGLGFSSTRGDTVTVRVTGDKIGGTYNVTF